MSPNRSTLRLAVLASLAIPLLSGCHAHPPDTSGLVPVAFQTDWYPQPEHGGFYDALAKGYYRDEGLNVTILPGGPYASTGALVASGKIQFAMDSSDHVLEAIANTDEPIVAIGATMQSDPQGVMVHADSPVKTWADLNGHAVALRPGSTWWTFLVQTFHLDRVQERPLTYSVANFVKDPNYIQQCFLTSEPYFADRAGKPARVLLVSDAGYRPYRVFITSRLYLQQHPDIVAKFTRASIRGWRDYMQDPKIANAMIEQRNPAMSRDWAAYSYAALKQGNFVTGPDVSGAQVGQFDPARWTTMYRQLRDLHVLHKTIDPATAYTLQFAGAGIAGAGSPATAP
jgi:NitT/TauT family transport system substrate-binding protein